MNQLQEEYVKWQQNVDKMGQEATQIYQKFNEQQQFLQESIASGEKYYDEIRRNPQSRTSYTDEQNLHKTLVQLQSYLNEEWEKALTAETQRTKLLKECRDFENFSKTYDELTQPIIQQTRENIEKAHSQNRLYLRKIFRLECQKLVDETKNKIEILQQNLKKDQQICSSYIKAGKITVLEKKLAALQLKKSLLSGNSTTNDINEFYQTVERMYPPLNALVQQDYLTQLQTYLNVIQTNLNNDIHNMLQSIQNYILAYEKLDPFYAGILGYHDRNQIENQITKHKLDNTKIANEAFQEHFSSLDNKIKEKDQSIQNMNNEKLAVKKNLDNINKIQQEYIDASKLQEKIKMEMNKKANAGKKKKHTNEDQSILEICNGFMYPINEFFAKAKTDEDIKNKYQGLKESIEKLNSSQNQYTFEQKKSQLNDKRISFINTYLKQGENFIKLFNPKLIIFYEPGVFELSTKIDSTKSILKIASKNSSKGALAEAIVNPYNEEPEYPDIMILYISQNAQHKQISTHIESLVEFVQKALDDKKNSTQIKYEEFSKTEFKPRQYKPPGFENINPKDIQDKFMEYINEWTILDPEEISSVECSDQLKKIIKSSDHYMSNNITSILENPDAKKASIKLNKLTTEIDINDKIAKYYTRKFYQNFMDMSIKDLTKYFFAVVEDAKPSSKSEIYSVTKKNKELQKIQSMHNLEKDLQANILNLINSYKVKAITAWVDIALEAHKQNNHALFYPIAELLTKDKIFDAITKTKSGSSKIDYKNKIEEVRNILNKDSHVNIVSRPDHKYPTSAPHCPRLHHYLRFIYEKTKQGDFKNDDDDFEKLRKINDVLVRYIKYQLNPIPPLYKIDEKPDKILGNIKNPIKKVSELKI